MPKSLAIYPYGQFHAFGNVTVKESQLDDMNCIRILNLTNANKETISFGIKIQRLK